MPSNTPPQDPAAPPPADFYSAETLRPETSVGFLMKRSLQSIMLRADGALAEWDLPHAQWMPLFCLSAGEHRTAAMLARQQALDPGAMTRALDRLEAKALVRRERSLTDRRVQHVVLTEAGQQLAARVPEVLAEVLNAHLAGFSPDEWQQLIGLLRRIVANGDALREAKDSKDKDL